MSLASFWRRNRVLVVVFSGLVAVALIQGVLTSRKNIEKNRLYQFSIADVQAVGIVNDKIQMTFVRDGQGWSVTGNPEFKLSKSDMDSFLDDLRHVQIVKNISGADLSKYGLDRTNSAIELAIDGKKDLLVSGAATPSGKGFYVSTRQPGKSILVLKTACRELFQKDLYYFRDKKVLDFSVSRTTGVRLTWRGLTVSLRKGEGTDTWTASFPTVHAVPPEQVNNLLFELDDLTVREFVEGISLNLAYYGFPSGISLGLQSKDGTSQSLEFAGQAGEGGIVMKNADKSTLLRVDYYFLTSLSNYINIFTNRTSKGEGHDPE